MSTSFNTFIEKLRRSLTRYYSVSYSNDTHLYYILQIYAAEFASGSSDLEEAHKNLSIDTANTQKLYDNFGTYFEQLKYFYQNANEDVYTPIYSLVSGSGGFAAVTGSGSISSYRKTIDFLMQAAMNGSTVYAIKRVGHAFTLVTPDIREPYRISRWKLKTDDGSISSASSGYPYIIGDEDKSWKDGEWDGALLLESGSSDLCQVLENYLDNKIKYYPITRPEHIFSVGNEYTITFSKLGSNTRLYDKLEKCFAAIIIIWLPQGQSGRKPAIEKALNDMKPAHVNLNVDYENYYTAQTTTEQLSSGSSSSFPYSSYDHNVFLVEYGAVKSLVPTINASFSGSTTNITVPGTYGFVKSSGSIVNNIYTSPILDLSEVGPLYANYDWAYDWVVNLGYDCRILVEAKLFNSLPPSGNWIIVNAGDVVYYSDIKRYCQYRAHVFTLFTGSFSLHQFSMKQYLSSSSDPYYTSVII